MFRGARPRGPKTRQAERLPKPFLLIIPVVISSKRRWAVVAVLLLGAGCAKPAPELEPISSERWREALAGHRGSTVVVNVWASWCRPCVELFPSIVALYQEHEPRGVRFISLCLDDKADASAVEAARSFLVEQQATFPNYLLQQDIAKSFDDLDIEGVPAVLVYGPDERLRYRLQGDPLENEISPADVADAIESLQ